MRLATMNLKVWSAQALDASADARPGDIVAAGDDGIDVATSAGILRITVLQPEGKRAMSAAQFINGFKIAFGFGLHLIS